MYQAPRIIPTTVFATYPEAMRVATAANDWIAGQPPGMPTGCFLEGPSFDRNGNLWCVDIPNGRILRVSPAGAFTIVSEYDGWPNGLKIHRDGRIFVADYKNGIMVVDPASGRVVPFLVRAGVERFKGVNDLFFASNGDLYFTDQGLTGLHDPTGRLFRATPDGTVTCLLDGIPSPNGLVMSAAENAIMLRSPGQCHLVGAADGERDGWRRLASSCRCRVAPGRTGWRWMRRADCSWPTPAKGRSGYLMRPENQPTGSSPAPACTRPISRSEGRTAHRSSSRNQGPGPSCAPNCQSVGAPCSHMATVDGCIRIARSYREALGLRLHFSRTEAFGRLPNIALR
jgi:streptogramin lyase